ISGAKRGRDKTLAMTARFEPKSAERDRASDILAAIRRAARQEQFLEVVSAEEARARFTRNVDLLPLPGETVGLSAALGRVLACDVTATIDVRRAVAPGQFISYAGSDIARGEVVLRRKTSLSSREIGMLAACGLAAVEVMRKPTVAVLSTGDELVAPGGALAPGRVYDSNGAIIAAAIAEAG